MRLPTRKSERDRAAMSAGDDVFVTKEKIDAMKRELERLIGTERRRLADEVHRTAQMGDLSENAAYQEAKQQLRRTNSRITTLEERIKRAVPIAKGVGDDGRVRVGSTVTIESGGKRAVYTILGSLESDPSRGRISYRSPLGSALVGHRTGDEVDIAATGGSTTYEIIDVH